MFRKPSKEDITQEEFDKYISKQNDDELLFLNEYLIPEFVAFALANGFNKGYMEYNNYDILIKTELTYFNIKTDENDVRKKVTTILREKYNLYVVNEKPLELIESSSN